MVFVASMILAACTTSTSDSSTSSLDTTTTAPVTTTMAATTAAPATTITEVAPVRETVEVVVTGPEEMVFDWSEDNCEPENIPDIASRAFRDADGQVNLLIGHYVNYRMIGPSLDDLTMDCSAPIMRSAFDPDPSTFNDSEWITSPYTFDGETVFAIVHNEYRGDTHDSARPGQCPSSDRFTCLDTSVTMAVSTDGGRTFTDIAEAPDHMVATLPYAFDDEGLPTGLRQPSNIVRGSDGLFYVYTNVSDYPDEEQWVCAMRSGDLSNPDSWRYWDGEGFNGVFLDPYVTDVGAVPEVCAPMDRIFLTGSVQEAVVYVESIDRYVMFGTATAPLAGVNDWGVYYSVSEDLMHWTQRRLAFELTSYGSVDDPEVNGFYAYVSVLDPDSSSMSFDTTDGSAYVYMTRFNEGTYSLDRDLVRFPIEIGFGTPETVTAPDWGFDTDGDTEGWNPLFGVTSFQVTDGNLLMKAGADPHFGVSGLAQPSVLSTLNIRMRISDGGFGQGQVFFATDTQPAFEEFDSVLFDVQTDDEFHDYAIDMSSDPDWDGLITAIRIDPIFDGPATVEVDRIWLDAG